MNVEIEQIFDDARSYNGYQDRPVDPALLRRVYDHAKWGATAANSCPARFAFISSDAGKERLLPCINPGNVAKVQEAPVTVIIAADTRFHELMPQLFPSRDFASVFAGKQAVIDDILARNVPLQGAYFMIAARALGLGCGPMSGFDAAKVDAEFFADGRWRSNFICTIGYGREDSLFDRNPRLDFEDACCII